MSNYYANKLSAERLRRCYELAPPRVRQYLEAELNFVLNKIKSTDLVLELGCGYGRIIPALAGRARRVVGIDTSISSLRHAQQSLSATSNYHLVQADAAQLSFPDRTFDAVICVQNGISAFHVDQEALVRESVRVTKRGGKILFSSYSDKFWEHRLDWFRRQSEAGLVGEIDFGKTGDGVIVCKDGFTAFTINRERFLALAAHVEVDATIIEVDGSSLFCGMVPR